MTKETNKCSCLRLPVVDAAAGDVVYHLQKTDQQVQVDVSFCGVNMHKLIFVSLIKLLVNLL
jgi:hypothetical protein